MIVLDSDVVSALMRDPRSEAIHDWIEAQVPRSLYITVITVFEVRNGIALLPAGIRREGLRAAWEEIVSREFLGRILKIDVEAAVQAADLAAERKTRGLNIDIADTMIAGIVLAHDATIATGNVKDFCDLGARVVNPWEASSPS